MLINRIILAVLIIGSGIFASFYGGNVSYAFFYFMLMIPAISFLYTFYVYMRFRLYQEIEQRIIVKGDLTPYSFTIGNEDHITFRSVKVNFLYDKSRILNSENIREYCLLPGASETMETKLRCNYRGNYYVGVNSVEIMDFLYLFKITYPIQSKLPVTVLPRVLTIDRLRIAPAQKDTKNSPFLRTTIQDEMDIETRKYQTGDSRKQVHWKVTAKRNELFSRKFTSNPKSEAFLVMDMQDIHEDDLTNIVTEDQIIESTLAIANYFKNNSTNINIYYDQDKLEKTIIRSKIDFDVFYQMCLTLRFHSKLPVDRVLDMCRQDYGQDGFFIVITHKLTKALYRRMLDLSQEGQDLALLLIKDAIQPDEDNILDDLKLAGIPFRLMTREDEIEEVLSL